MPGFLISNITTEKVPYIFENCCHICEKIGNREYTINRNVISKFSNDRLFFEANDYIVILDGVILNKSELLKDQENAKWGEYVLKKIESDPLYFDMFRGTFCGAHYDKKQQKWLIYTDIMSTKPLFYYFDKEHFIISEDMLVIVDILKENGIPYRIDDKAVYDDLTYGYMIGNRTLIDSIKKVPYGSYVEYSNKELKISRYYDFEYNVGHNVLDEREIIEKMDLLFKKAIELEFEKDKEYGYSHFVTLSGGCDSRMDTWIAKSMGYDDILNVCICEADMLDEKCAKKVSQKIGTEFVVKTLNGGGFLSNFRDIAAKGYGLVNYAGISPLVSVLNIVDKEKFGLVHTGELGDVVVGTYYDKMYAPRDFVVHSALNGSKVEDLYDESEELPEKFLMRNRGFNGCIGTWLTQGHYFETISPFLYREFFEYCIANIPHDMRKSHYIYNKWIIEKWPDLGAVPFERFYGGKITDSRLKKYYLIIRHYGIAKCLDWALRKMGVNKKRRRFDKTMNPMDKWYCENSELRDTLNDYYSKTMVALKDAKIISEEICHDIQNQYENGAMDEKMSTITVLSALELFFL